MGWSGTGCARARTCALELSVRAHAFTTSPCKHGHIHTCAWPQACSGAHGQRGVGTAGFVYYTRAGHVARGFVVFVEKGPCRFKKSTVHKIVLSSPQRDR